MLLTTADKLGKREILEHKGLVTGIIVRTPTITQGILGGLKILLAAKILPIQMYVKKQDYMLSKR
jgi:uncharacterized protein YbjQ (UPF0145 family)